MRIEFENENFPQVKSPNKQAERLKRMFPCKCFLELEEKSEK